MQKVFFLGLVGKLQLLNSAIKHLLQRVFEMMWPYFIWKHFKMLQVKCSFCCQTIEWHGKEMDWHTKAVSNGKNFGKNQEREKPMQVYPKIFSTLQKLQLTSNKCWWIVRYFKSKLWKGISLIESKVNDVTLWKDSNLFTKKKHSSEKKIINKFKQKYNFNQL